jgi:hypothetical protein
MSSGLMAPRLGVGGASWGIPEVADKVGFRGFLQGLEGLWLEPDVGHADLH